MRILICDDQAIIRDGLALLLRLERDMEVVGKAQNGAEALALTREQRLDLVLMDLKMPGMNGIEATRRISAECPKVRVLVLTTYVDDEWVMDALRAGAHGYLLKDTPRQQVVQAIRGTVTGKSYLDPAVAPLLIEQALTKTTAAPAASSMLRLLTSREQDVLSRLARGRNNAEIARELHLSNGAVRNHVTATLHELGVSDRTQAALLAVRHGLDKQGVERK